MAAILILFLPISLAACSRGAKQGSPPVAIERLGDLEARLSTTKQSFKRKEIIPLKLVIENTSAKETRLEFASAKTHDFIVKTSGGAPVWRWSGDRVFAQSFFSKTLKSGEKLLLSSNWNQETDRKRPAAVGKYAVEAELNAGGKFLKPGPLFIEIVE